MEQFKHIFLDRLPEWGIAALLLTWGTQFFVHYVKAKGDRASRARWHNR